MWWRWWWWWRENNRNVVVVVVVVLGKENNRILWPANLYKCATFCLFSQSTFCSWGVDMSWCCFACEKSFSRKDNMQRHVVSKHRNAGLTPFQTVPVFSQKCQRFRFKHDCRNDRVRKNVLGSISIATSFRDNLPFPRRGTFGVIHNGSLRIHKY